MKLKIYFTFLYTFSFVNLFANDSLLFVRKIPISSRIFSTDPIGNIYVLKGNNSLIKYNSAGDSIGFFNEIKKGKITQIDASNPLRILLFYADYGNILILDNVLSLKSSLKLNNLGIVNAPCIANSADGSIWVVDPVGTLVKINSKPEINFTTSLRNVLDKSIDPIYMTEHDRALYIVDSLEGVLKFDQFGLFKTSYPFFTNEIQVFNTYLVYFASPYLISYNTLSMQENKILIPEPDNIVKVRIERDFVFVLRFESLDIYSLPTKNDH